MAALPVKVRNEPTGIAVIHKQVFQARNEKLQKLKSHASRKSQKEKNSV